MGLFKKKIVKEIDCGTWGHLVSVHKVDVDTLSKELRLVEQDGVVDDGRPVTLQRVFRPKELTERGVEVTGWQTFDENPEFIIFEGYLGRDNQASLERRRS